MDPESKAKDGKTSRCNACIADADQVMVDGIWNYECKCHSFKKSDDKEGKIDATGTGANFKPATCDLCPRGCLRCSDDKTKCFYPCD
jgi:hypothetical protein